MRYRLRTLVFVVPLVVAIVFSLIVREILHDHAVRNLEYAMTREQVLELCGPPQERPNGDEWTWTYDIWWAQGWANVYFDDQDQVHGIDIESPFDGL
ncbi:hypothetical protein NG895_21415 [Aeoliella sp. ICT_H6.2]|uniref:Uncharacterized protein n=1 Tax=Aeoliella straminimaris TaxID=2954799 RepID=A0A9X2JI38_9BACT|nr:hypothetical protein [Aeoliella straminimaris]MCO6046466.1 hypothetical protein [Aeoliella straminimaris]